MLRELREPLVLIMEFFQHLMVVSGVRNEYANYLRTIPILRQQNNWAVGWVRKIDIRFLLMFSTVLFYADISIGWVRKSQKMCRRNIWMVPYQTRRCSEFHGI